MKSQPKIVLDAWALLALIFGEEPAARTVKEIFERKGPKSSVNVSWINLGEVYYTIARRKGQQSAEEVLNDIKLLPISFHEALKADVLAAAKIKSKYQLSYADAFAVSLTKKINGTIFTGDPEIIVLHNNIRVRKLSRAV